MPDTAPADAIAVERLGKVYRTRGRPPVEALKDLTLAIPRGSLFGLLGPNGAGKSTLINILAGLVIKTAGVARVWGFDVEREMRRARRAIGVVPQELNIDPFFTPRQALEVQAGLFGVRKRDRRTDEILARLGLTEQADAYARTLSGGMRRRLLMAKAMVHSPPVLVLDEPTAGVDIELRQQIWAYVRELNARGVTILLTTHYLTEAEQLCDRIAIVNRGRLIACDRKEGLIGRLDSKHMIVVLGADLEAIPAPLKRFDVALREKRSLVFHYAPSRVHSGEILTAVQAAGLTIADLTTRESDLEDVFLRLTRADAAHHPDA